MAIRRFTSAKDLWVNTAYLEVDTDSPNYVWIVHKDPSKAKKKWGDSTLGKCLELVKEGVYIELPSMDMKKKVEKMYGGSVRLFVKVSGDFGDDTVMIGIEEIKSGDGIINKIFTISSEGVKGNCTLSKFEIMKSVATGFFVELGKLYLYKQGPNASNWGDNWVDTQYVIISDSNKAFHVLKDGKIKTVGDFYVDSTLLKANIEQGYWEEIHINNFWCDINSKTTKSYKLLPYEESKQALGLSTEKVEKKTREHAQVRFKGKFHRALVTKGTLAIIKNPFPKGYDKYKKYLIIDILTGQIKYSCYDYSSAKANLENISEEKENYAF